MEKILLWIIAIGGFVFAVISLVAHKINLDIWNDFLKTYMDDKNRNGGR